MRIIAVLIDISFQKSWARSAIVWQSELFVFKLNSRFHSHRNDHRIRPEILRIFLHFFVAFLFQFFPWTRILLILLSWNSRDWKIGKKRRRFGQKVEKIVEIFGNFGNERFTEAFNVFYDVEKSVGLFDILVAGHIRVTFFDFSEFPDQKLSNSNFSIRNYWIRSCLNKTHSWITWVFPKL